MTSAMLRDVPLQKKLRWIFLIVSGAALLGAFAVFLTYQWISSRSSRSAQLQVMAEIVGDQGTAAVEFGQKDQAKTILAALRAEPEIVAAAVYDKDGRLFARYPEKEGNPRGVPERPGPDGQTYEGRHLRIFHPMTSAGERIGTFHLRSDMRHVWDRLWVNLGTAALVLLGAILTVLMLSAKLGRWVTLPVFHLANVVQNVTSTKDYSVRAEPYGRDELGRLIEGFNDMLSEIQKRDEAVARGREDLERRVEERTRELRDEVAERRQAEKNLKDKDLRLSEAQQIARMGSWEWDLASQKVAWSDEIYRILGLLPSDFQGTPEAFLKQAHPDDRARLKEKIEESLQKREPFSLDIRTIRPDGEVRSLLVHGKVVLDDAGQPVRLVGIMQDITERKRADAAIQELNRKLQAGMEELASVNKELEGFSYSVSHDLRSPLRAIDGYSRMLGEDCSASLSDKGRRYIDVIRGSTQKMGQLIDDLLSFSRMGRKHVEFSRIDMESLARVVYSEVETINPGRNIDFRLGSLPPSQGDPAMIRQVFANLFSNAVKYSRDRNPAVIEVSGRTEGGETIYSVKDNGVGFDMEYAGKLFGVFQRLHSSKQFEGTGVGLALVQRIVQRHGGQVWATGKVDEGATFAFALPNKEVGHVDSSRS